MSTIAEKKKGRSKAKPSVKVEAPELIEEPVKLWTVTSVIVDRTPKRERVSTTVKVRVSKLYYLSTLMMTLEGPCSDSTLAEAATLFNARGTSPVTHVKAFADLPTDGARSKEMLKKQTFLVGPEFTPPPPRAVISLN